MTPADRQTLLAAATAALAGRAQTSVQRVLNRWELQTSNSFRRIGTTHGDGDVLCGTKHPVDGHPDLLAAPGVLDYVVAAQPSVVIELLDDVASLEDKLAAAKILCDRIGDVETKLNTVAGTIAMLSEALAQLTSPDPEAAKRANILIDQLFATLQGGPR